MTNNTTTAVIAAAETSDKKEKQHATATITTDRVKTNEKNRSIAR